MPEQRHGLLLLDKPAGRSSFQAIAALRPTLGRKVGHAGTLDPFATGLLLVLAGRATRFAPYLAGLEKQYLARVQFGAGSSTDDVEGELTPRDARTDAASVAAAIPQFVGRIRQVPPAASAVHIDGERAYRRFRRGETVTMPTREVEVHRLTLVAFDAERQTADIDVTCSTGTYIRALARDLGEELGTAAYCSALRRTRIGPFPVGDAATDAWRSCLDALPHLPAMEVDEATAVALGHGRTVALDTPAPVRLVHAGALIAVGVAGDGGIRPAVVLVP